MISVNRILQGLSNGPTPEAIFVGVLALSALVSEPEVTRLPGDACVSAIFGVTFLKVLFSSDHAGILGFWIGGVVRKILRKSEFTAQRILKSRFSDVLMNPNRCKFVRVGSTSLKRCRIVEVTVWREQGP